MKKEYGLVCSLTGGSMPFDVESISIGFICYQRATIEQARKLEVEVTEKFLARVNEHKKIRPFLREYPFKSGRIEIEIAFENLEKGTRYMDGSVAFIYHVKDKLFYKQSDKDEHLLKLYEEPYEKAYQIVKGKI
jgi:hypothetical protein